jgi:tetratricopeptide (TPR) repeat protein
MRRLSPVLVGIAAVAAGASGCAAPAESADLEAAPPGSEAVAPDLTPDPVALYLARPAPAAEQEAQLLEALRVAVDDARNDRASSELRRSGALRVDAILGELAVLEDWRPLIVAELLAPLGDTARVDAALGELDPATGIGARWGWAFRVAAYEVAGDTAGALRVAEEEADRTLTLRAGAPARARAGQLALVLGDTARARGSFQLALEAGPGNEGAQAAARSLDRIHTGTRDESARIGETLLEGGAWEAAVRRLTPLLAPGPAVDPGEAGLRIGVGRALVELRRPSEARALLEPLTGEAVPDGLAGPALYWTGVAALQQNRPGEAEAAFLRLARRAPTSALAEEGLLLLVERASQAGSLDRQPELLAEFLRVGVGSTAGELITVQHGSRRYLGGGYREAAETFDRYLEGARRTASRQQAAYWSALSHERLGDRTRAEERLALAWAEDPLSFYGTLAGERIDAAVLDPGLLPGPGPVPGIGGEVRAALIRLRVHQVVPTAGSFAWELERLQDHFHRRGDSAYDFAEALFAGGFPIQGIVLGRDIHRREGAWNLRLLRIVFPFPHREVIVREARARGLDPFFVAGLIRQESMFHPSIASSAGAIGLMQLLPGTAQEVARSLGIRYERARLDDPEYNVRLGTQYLAQMLRRFDGRAEDALSAYNAGPGRITQWRQRPEYRDRDVFMEHIPFRETRHYVKVVQQNTRIYTALYGCAGFEPCLGDSYRVAVARSPYAGGQPGSALAR